MSKKGSFELLPIPRKELGLTGSRYRVYKDKREFVVVEAANAAEALKASGLPEACRIERDHIFFENVLDLETLAKTPAPNATAAAAPASAVVPVETPPVAAPAEAEAPPPPVAAPAAPLSGDEVDKLLQS